MRQRLLSPLLLGIMLFSSPVPAQDEPLPGHRTIDLMWDCQSKGQQYTLAAEQGMDAEFFGRMDLIECVSYIGGMADMNAMAQGILGRSFFCLPKGGIQAEQQVMVFLKWAEEHPELLHESRRSGVISAFVEAFPCS